jgi:hypothetical protein
MNLSKELLITSKHWWTKEGPEVFTWDARQYKGHPVEGAQQEFVLVSEWVSQIWEHGNLHDSVAAVLSLANHCSPSVNQHVWNTTLSVASTMALILPHNRVPAKHPKNHQNQKHKLQHFHDKSLTASSSCPGNGKAKGERETERKRNCHLGPRYRCLHHRINLSKISWQLLHNLNIVLEWLHKMTHIKNVSKITAPRNQISERTSVQREKYTWQFNDPPLWKFTQLKFTHWRTPQNSKNWLPIEQINCQYHSWMQWS